MARYKIWISNYNLPNDQFQSYPEKLIKSSYPSVTGGTIRVYVRDASSVRDDITAQLEELRENDRLQPGDEIELFDVFSGGTWTVKENNVRLDESS